MRGSARHEAGMGLDTHTDGTGSVTDSVKPTIGRSSGRTDLTPHARTLSCGGVPSSTEFARTARLAASQSSRSDPQVC
jgi:hypothetical protein